MSDGARDSFAEKILDLRDEAAMNELHPVAEYLDKAFAELERSVECSYMPAEGRALYDLVMMEMLELIESKDNVFVFPSSRVRRIILSDDQIKKMDPGVETQ